MGFDNKGGIKKTHSTVYWSITNLQCQMIEVHKAIFIYKKDVNDYGGTHQLEFI